MFKDTNDFQQMFHGIVEKHQLQFLCVLDISVEVLHAIVCSLSQKLQLVDGFVVSWTELDDCAFLILFIWSQEIGEQEMFVSSELVVDFGFHSKAFD